MKWLEGKAVVITGSGRGLGTAYALLAAQEGASVVVNDLDADDVTRVVDQIVSAGGTAVGAVVDITSPSGPQELIDTCVDEFGAVDGLVNNAGLQMVGGPTELDEERAQKLMDVNVMASIRCGARAMIQMKRQGSGSIVNITSGTQMGIRNLAVYAASKGAIASLTYSWAADLEGTGVRVNAFNPFARTRMAFESVGMGASSPEERDSFLAEMPDPADNAPAVVYLLSDASKSVSGQILRIDGQRLYIVGRPALLSPPAVAERWTVAEVEAAMNSTLRDKLMVSGLQQLTGQYEYRPLEQESPLYRPSDT